MQDNISEASPFRTRDGLELYARLLTIDDRALLVRFFYALSPQSRRRRFHIDVEKVDRATVEERIAHFVDVDNTRLEGAVIALDSCDEIVGVARLARRPDKPDSEDAEAAIVIRDDLQGRGVGSELLRRLVLLGEQMHVRTMVAEIESDNDKALRLFRKLGLPTKTIIERGSTILQIQLPR